MTRIVLVRHGQSLWNRERRIQGQSGSGLSDVGHRQAEAVAAWLAMAHPGAAVVSSDLLRCVETAEPIGRALGTDVHQDPDLRERHFGQWQGLTLDDVASDHPDRWDRWRAGEDVVPEVGGESGVDLGTRVAAALDGHADAHGGGTVVAVTHGGAIWHGLHALLGVAPPLLGGVGNTAVSEVVRDAGRWLLDGWNGQAHVPEGLRSTFQPSQAGRAPAVGR